MPERHLVVVPHTHWDREWYQSFETFRYRLVRLLDDALDLLERDPAFRHFTLDGQTIVLSDYLEVRPQARERIAKLVREGRLLIGPWYVLPDEWLVSGEALIRNLRRGLAQARELGPPMRLGYVPDQFGHVGQLPQIFAGFGCQAAVLWRGVPAGVDESLFWWEAPDGTRLLAVYLMHGYGNAVHLPLEPDALAARLGAEAERLAARSRIPTLLLMNGSDHVPPQPGLPAALAAAAARLPGTGAEIGTLPGFVERARREAPGAALPLHRGELRSGLRAPLLEGCASARMAQKRADFLNDRLLTRQLEPLAAWLAALGGDADPAFIELAWRIALENHPHDSICGCSIDAVHEQMDARFARVADVAQAHLRRVAAGLARRIAAPAAGDARDPAVAVWNPHAAGMGEAEGELELDLAAGRARPALHLLAADGRRIPAAAERVDAGEVAARYRLAASGAAILVRGLPPEFMGLFVRGLRAGGGARARSLDVLLGAEKPAGFDFEAEKARALAWLAEAGEAPVTFRALRLPRFRLRFVDDLPGCGLRVYRVARGGAGGAARLRAERLADGGAAIENEHVRLEAAPDGRLRFEDRRSGVVVEDALRLVSEGDRGDEYNFDPVPGAERVERPARARLRLPPASEAEAALVLELEHRVPAALGPRRDARSARRVGLRSRLELRLARGLPRVAVALDVDNRARDHRLRLHVRAPFVATRFEVESAFEVAVRPIAPGPGDFGSERPAELPIGATPQRSFASLRDGARALSVANRGCAEVEAVPEAGGGTSLALTVLRAVGWLSRGDLALRPGHAGPALATPGAQAQGPQRLEIAFWLHADGDLRRVADAHRYAAPAWPFPAEGGAQSPLCDGARLLEIDDPAVVVSAIEPRVQSSTLVRLYNASDAARRVEVRWRGPGAHRLEPVDLAGHAVALDGFRAGEGASASLQLRPWQIVTLETD